MKALMKGGERDFAEVMTRLVSCNHFLPERMALEREALGSAFVDEGAAWNLNFDSSSRSPNIQRLTEKTSAVVERLLRCLIAGRATISHSCTTTDNPLS